VSVFVLGNLSVDDIAGVLMTDGGLWKYSLLEKGLIREGVY
jgi:hypothetical protein